jgi:predicted O-linked N-acetylglucosamine transferase (SPINDLY family)
LSETKYVQWMARGRNHQLADRPLDALQCFRRAAREWPRGVEARFHLGEALWKLGRLDEGLRAWREAASTEPRFLAAWQALAEASLGMGDAQGAREAAERVLGIKPRDSRAQAVKAIAAYADDEMPLSARVEGVKRALARRATWLALPAFSGALALALERAGADETLVERIRVVAEEAGAEQQLHPRMHALVCEHVAARTAPDDAWFARMLERDLPAEDHDALRRVAYAAARAGVASAPALALAYARLCVTAFGARIPLLWPQRTGGERLRVAVLVGSAKVAALHAMLRGSTAEVTLVVSGDVPEGLQRAGDAPQASRRPDDAPHGSQRPGDAPHASRGPAIVALSARPGVDDAQRVATLDADILIDAAGLAAASGPLLAQRPARRIVSTAPYPNVAPLVNETIDPAQSLEAWLSALPVPFTASPDAATLDRAWKDAVAAHRGGDGDAAAAAYARILEWQPGYAPALYLSGSLARDRGDLEGARERFAAALVSAPRYDDARIAALSAAAAAHDTQAIATLSQGITPASSVPLLRAGGLAWLAAHDGGRAASFFEAALRQEPADGETHYNHGVALQMQRRFEDAARAYQRAVVCRPDLVAADFNLGVIFTALGNVDGAVAAYGAVLARKPEHVAAHKNLGEVLLAAGRIDAWLAHFKRFEAQCPNALPLALHALEACHYLGDFAALERYLDGLRRERYVAADDAELADTLEQLLYLLLYFDVEPEMVHRLSQTYDRVATHLYGEPLPSRAARRPGKIRIGYLSADLRNHVMGKMAWAALRHHDRDRFALHFYAMSPVRDEWTERFAGIADRFVPVADLDDRAAVAAIAADDLDILVDLNTHTKGARPGIPARKPARVQITHIASAGTLGLRAVDFKLTDHFADVEENQAFQIEKLLPMQGCVYPYRHIEPVREHGYHRAALGIADDAVVIGAFVNPLKLSRRCLTLWRTVLDRVPRARLAFSPLDNALRNVLRRLMAAADIAPERIVFVPTGPDESHNQARYAVVDLVLDPMPYGGVNGTLEALDMQIPVVTLRGMRHGERTSYSILANLGVTDTVAESGRDYVEIAVRLAEDAAFRADVKARIAAALPRSALTDMQAHTRHLEAAYLEALAQAAPEALDSAGR